MCVSQLGSACVVALALFGCKPKEQAVEGGTGAGASAAQPPGASAEAKAVPAPSAGAAAIVTPAAAPAALDLSQTHPIPGTPISLSVPGDVKREGRALLFRSSGPQPITVRLTYALNIAGDAHTMLQNALHVYNMNDWFKEEGGEVRVDKARDFFMLQGKMTRDATGMNRVESAGTLATLVQNGRMLSAYISHPPARAAEVRKIVESLALDPNVEGDPMAAYGVSFNIPPGYHRNNTMFEPLYWYPKGINQVGPSGPSLELRFRLPQERELTYAEMIPAFAKDPSTAKCVDTAEVRADKLQGKDCTVVADSVGSPFRVRIYSLEDSLGAVIGIVRSPLFDGEVEYQAIDSMLQSLRLGGPAAPAAPAAASGKTQQASATLH